MRPWRWLLPALVVTLAVCGTALAQARVTAEEFADRLDQAADLARVGADQPSPAAMAEVREALGLPVDLDAGAWRLVVPQDPVLDGLAGESASEFERASRRIETLQHALQVAVARSVPESDEVQTALDRAYSGLVQEPISLPEQLLRYIGDLVSAVLYRILSFVGPNSLLVWATLGVLVVTAALLLRRARLVPEWIGPSPRSHHAVAVDWAARADEALRTGDVREAVRALYLALLDALVRGGFLADAPAMTAGEARRAVARVHPSIYPAVLRATASYERVVYGGVTPDAGDLQGLREAVATARTR